MSLVSYRLLKVSEWIPEISHGDTKGAKIIEFQALGRIFVSLEKATRGLLAFFTSNIFIIYIKNQAEMGKKSNKS